MRPTEEPSSLRQHDASRGRHDEHHRGRRRPPVRVGVTIANIGTGIYATQAILAALLYRELGDGIGQKVDVSLLDGQVAWMSYKASYYFATGESLRRMGSKHSAIPSYQAFETADGYIVVDTASKHLWPKFCRTLDRDHLIDDNRFSTNADRDANRTTLDDILDREFAQYSTAESVARMEAAGVPASRRLRNMEDVLEYPQVQARNMHQTIDHTTIGPAEMAGSPMHFS